MIGGGRVTAQPCTLAIPSVFQRFRRQFADELFLPLPLSLSSSLFTPVGNSRAIIRFWPLQNHYIQLESIGNLA